MRQSARLFSARGLTAALFATAALSLIGLSGSPASAQDVKDIKWGTGPVGASGQKALVVLANLLNKEWTGYRITVMPTPGAVGTVKGFAMEQFDGYYGSDVALKEYATDSGRFKDFKKHVKREPVQSLWCYTLDVGLAIKASNREKYKSWKDLKGKPVYTGPLPFDTRKHLENAMAALDVGHVYREVDIKTAGSQLENGTIEAIIIYAAGGKAVPPWLSEASLTVDWAALNPTAEEAKKLEEQDFAVDQVPAKNFRKQNYYSDKITLSPFFWGFDVGLNVPGEDVYRMLTIIEKNADELAKLDPTFLQISGGEMANFQAKALKSTWKLVPIHPGLAKYLKEKGKWDPKWDSNIAKG